MRTRSLTPIRLLTLIALLVLATFAVACENTTYVGVSYGHPRLSRQLGLQPRLVHRRLHGRPGLVKIER